MWSEEEIQSKLEEVQTALKNLNGAEGHFKTVYEAQIYILQNILEKKIT